jgi:hypothetical protein
MRILGLQILALLIGSVALAGVLTVGASLTKSSSPARFHACVNSHHQMVLLKRGRCRAGDHEVTVDARGPAGPLGHTARTI